MSAHKVTLHHLNESRSDRIAWLLEELEIDYDIKVYFRQPSGAAPPELKKVAPLGKAPIVQIDDRIIFESGAIVSELLRTFPHAALESAASPDSEFWAHFAEGTLMSFLQGGAAVNGTARGFAAGAFGVPATDEGKKAVMEYASWYQNVYVKSSVQAQLDVIEPWLAAHPAGYFSGTDKPGSGDVLMFFPLNSICYGGRAEGGFNVGPKTREWMDRVRARPACGRALERLRKAEEGAKAKM